jgi:hypothetical protein
MHSSSIPVTKRSAIKGEDTVDLMESGGMKRSLNQHSNAGFATPFSPLFFITSVIKIKTIISDKLGNEQARHAIFPRKNL